MIRMLKGLKPKSLLIGLALLALAGMGLLSPNAAQEAVWAEASQAQVTATLEISNTSMPIGGATYEIQMIIFTKNSTLIATQIIIPSAAIGPQETKTFAPFKLPTTPWGPSNDLVMVNYDPRPGMGGGIYSALNPPAGEKHAKVFPLTNWLAGGWIICWEVDPIADWNDQIDRLAYPIGP